jgi:hypothetical protein
LTKNITTDVTNIVDYSTFVSFGRDVLNSNTNREVFYNSLIDRIGKTVFAIREYKADDRKVLVDSFTFGSILQKISYRLQDSEYNSDWRYDTESGTSNDNPYTYQSKGCIVQKVFAQNRPTFAYKDLIYDFQLESSFVSPQAMGGFINGIYERMNTSLELAKEGMNATAINSFAIQIFESSVNASRRKRNLAAEYNTLHPNATVTSVQQAFESEDFLKFATAEIALTLPRLAKPTLKYNDGTVERHTSTDNLVVEIWANFTKYFDVTLASSTYHDELVKLPNYNGSVPYWVSETAGGNIPYNNGTEDTAIPNVICLMRDKDAVVATMDRSRFVNFYDQWNDRNCFKLTANRRYICDPSENAILYLND